MTGTDRSDKPKIVRRVVVLALFVAALVVSVSSNAFGADIVSFDADVAGHDAGRHEDASVAIEFRVGDGTISGTPGNPCFDPSGVCQVVAGGAAKDIVVELPKGLTGNPQAVDQCTLSELTGNACPGTSQVGVVDLGLIAGGMAQPISRGGGVYNMVPNKGELAQFGLKIAAINQVISVRVRNDGDYGLTTSLRNIYTGLPVWATRLTIWGVPGASVHDADRVCNGVTGCSVGGDAVAKPFMSNPTECGVDGITRLRVSTYQQPDVWTTAESAPRQVVGCEHLRFEPSLDVQPDVQERGQPAGLKVDIDVPQTLVNPIGIATPPLRDTSVTLPLGVSISPGSAIGLGGCSDAQLGIGTNRAAECPSESRIGDARLTTPLLDETLEGGIYLGTPLSDDPLSGDLFRIAIELKNEERGLIIKLPGKIKVDPVTGRVTAVFNDNPQLPFDSLSLRFKGGSRAPLALPVTCGSFATSADMTAWGVTQPIHVESTMNVTHNGSGQPCPRGFSPSFHAGTKIASAGKDSPLSVDFGRTDNDQDLNDITVDMPEGLLARVASVNLCGDAAASAGSCGEDSRIGSVTVGAGPGSTPYYLPGRVYFTGPYKGAPYGLSIVVPALAGPFNLGTVVVRAAAFVDRRTAALRVVSDPLPSILKGVILRVRAVGLDIDRPGFTFNPTSCAVKSVGARIGSTEGASANVASRFQVGDCASLPYKPKMTIKMGGRGKAKAGVSPPVEVGLTMRPGMANNKSVSVNFPLNVNARLPVINRNACTLEQFEAETCPVALRVGTATATTPLLRETLSGNAFFVRNPARRIPDIMVRLKGPVTVDLVGENTIPKNLTITSAFNTVPDVPITKFTLRLASGRNGPLGFVASPCTKAARAERAKVVFRGHNGKVVRAKQRLSIVGCRASTRAKRSAKKSKSKKAKK